MLKASGFNEVKLKITQPKQTIKTLAELITQSAVLIKEHNSFVSSSYIEHKSGAFSNALALSQA